MMIFFLVNYNSEYDREINHGRMTYKSSSRVTYFILA
jgi:hypothetical protein